MVTIKFKEFIIAQRVEEVYTKDEIINLYLNTVPFPDNTYGIESASQKFFNKNTESLTLNEAAILVGTLKANNSYNPRVYPDRARKRRDVVINQMLRYDYLNPRDTVGMERDTIMLSYQKHTDLGIAPYFRELIRQEAQDILKNYKKDDGSAYDLYQDGLTIHTTLDKKMQEYAENAVTSHIANLQKSFDRQNEKNPTAPFRDITEDEVESSIQNAMRVSARWKKMKSQGKSDSEIKKSFKEKAEMRVFSWKGTIDTMMTPRDSILYYKAFLQAGMMSMVPQTGEVKAWVGGIDFKHFKYEHVKQGKRQVGSTFKPFVYATAIDQLKFSPCDTLPRSKFTIEAGKHGNMKDWAPRNSDNEYSGMLSLKQALARSVNTITARLIDKTGPGPVIDLLGKLGIDTENVPAVPSIALGTADISLFEMVSAYSTFANQGVYIKPVMVNRIEDKNGTVLYQNVPETRDVLSKEAAYVTVNLLEGVTQGGSGTRLRNTWGTTNAFYKDVMTGYPYDFKNPIAGKTGTTQNQSDGWFMGMVPNLVSGVWVGGDDRSVHFPSITYGQGATMALPIWAVFMKKCYEDEALNISQEDFERPEDLSIRVDCSQPVEGERQEVELPDELDF